MRVHYQTLDNALHNLLQCHEAGSPLNSYGCPAHGRERSLYNDNVVHASSRTNRLPPAASSNPSKLPATSQQILGPQNHCIVHAVGQQRYQECFISSQQQPQHFIASHLTTRIQFPEPLRCTCCAPEVAPADSRQQPAVNHSK